MSVGVMKDYKLKLRKLLASHTLGWVNNREGSTAVFFFLDDFESCMLNRSDTVWRSCNLDTLSRASSLINIINYIPSLSFSLLSEFAF